VLARHDETYMPPEVADALKRSGHWNPARAPPPPRAGTRWNTGAPRERLMIPELGHFALRLALMLALAQAACRSGARSAVTRG
jgi:hypothetical protein